VEKWIIGIDEVGRGPLAGPVTVAAVAVPCVSDSDFPISSLKGIQDSKKCTRLGRKRWNAKIRQEFPFVIASVSEKIIDRDGIMQAIRSAVFGCLTKLTMKHNIPPAHCLVLLDGGLRAPDEYKNQKSIIKGDEIIPIISAASIIAKIHRDRYMVRLHKKYPLYGFDQHKGYGTKVHREAILKNGLSEVHRKTFCKNLHYIDKMV